MVIIYTEFFIYYKYSTMSDIYEKIKDTYGNIKNSISELAKKTNIRLTKNLKGRSTKISEKQRKLLEEFGKEIKPIGTKLVVVSDDKGCMLFKLTENDDIKLINLTEKDEIEVSEDKFKIPNIKSIERVFEKLFIIEYEKDQNQFFRIVRYNPNSNKDLEISDPYYKVEKWDSSDVSGKKDIKVRLQKDENSPVERFFSNDVDENSRYGCYIPGKYTLVRTK